jgi:hypothetical protein
MRCELALCHHQVMRLVATALHHNSHKAECFELSNALFNAMLTEGSVIGRCCGVRVGRHTEGNGAELFKAVCKLGLEGIVSKKLDASIAQVPRKPG